MNEDGRDKAKANLFAIECDPMSVIFVALPVAIIMGASAAWACVRCIRGGQFDDLESPAVRILLDDKPDPPQGNGPGVHGT